MTPTQPDYTASLGRPDKRKQHLDALRLVDLFACIAVRLLRIDARDWVCQPFTILPLHVPSPLLPDSPPIYLHYAFFKNSERLQRGLIGNRSIGKVGNKDCARVLSTYSPPLRFHPRSVNHSSVRISISICATFLSPDFYPDQLSPHGFLSRPHITRQLSSSSASEVDSVDITSSTIASIHGCQSLYLDPPLIGHIHLLFCL